MKDDTAEISERRGAMLSDEAPQVSVVIPAYKVGAFIGTTLESVFSQTFREFEAIVVNDGSPDREQLEAAVEPFLERIVYVTQPNAGAGAARNTALRFARGKIIAFLDGDDIWYPNYLAEQTEFLEAAGSGMVYCDAELFGIPSVNGQTFMEQAPSAGDVDVDGLLDLRCNVITSGTVVLKSALETAGNFESERVKSEDFHLWVRVALGGTRIRYQRKVLLRYRVSAAGLSGDSVNRVERAIDVFTRLKTVAKLNVGQMAIIERRLAGFETDAAVERGKAFLLAENYPKAREEFWKAFAARRSPKLIIACLCTQLAPRLLLRLYRSKNSSEVALITNLEGAAESQH